MKKVDLLKVKLQNSRVRQAKKLNERRKQRSKKNEKLLSFILSLVALVLFLSLHFLDNQEERPVTKDKDVSQVTKTEARAVAKPKTVNQVEAKVMAVSTKVVKQEEPKEESSIYNPDVPMPKEHQEYLYKLCEEKGLDYKQTLAVIQHESVFDPNATNVTNDFGYFQINQINHETLASKLQTANDPFDPYVNMQWGTYMLADLYQYWSDKGYQGQGLSDAVWSSYNRGKTGFLRNGHAVEYVSKMKASVEQINNLF
jgi:hypothetical protein